MVTIAVDLMGGDNPPGEIAQGARKAAAELDVQIALVGRPDVLRAYGKGRGQPEGRILLVEAPQVVEMGESPTDAWREKKASSIAVGVRMLAEGQADAFVSPGNTGAIAATSLFTLGTIEGVDRPAIATLYTTRTNGIAAILDIGANVDCRPPMLAQFAHLGSDFLEHVFGVARPRVALLSNGEEPSKGTRLVKETHKLLRESRLNFIGNIDGFGIHSGVADVVVTDGFTGNVVLKLAEGLAGSIFGALGEAMEERLLTRLTKFLWGPAVRSVGRRWDYTAVGGAPLLGVRGNVIMAHGRSDRSDIRNAIALAARMVREGGWQRDVSAPNLEPARRI